jgi:hypothetical protein
MGRTHSDGSHTTYGVAFAYPTQKQLLKSAWTLDLDQNEVLAIAYVLLEKRANATRETVNVIHDVTYTQGIFNEIVGYFAEYTHNVHGGEFCPPRNCTETWVDNPEWIALDTEYSELLAEYDAITADLSAEPPPFNANQTPQYLQGEPTCNGLHNLHVLSLTFRSSADVMDRLGFNSADRQWVESTKFGFENNPNLM